MAKTLKRHVGLHHVVFFRACMEDPDDLHTADLASRYLETGTNLHEANKVLRLVQEALTQVARRQGHHGAARLLNLPRGRLRVATSLLDAGAAPPAVTFEEFKAQYDPNEAFGYQELLEIYEAEHGAHATADLAPAPSRTEREAKRAVRLLTKKIRLINDLSLEIIRDPQPEDWVMGWFAEKISNRLEAVSIRTLQDIIDYANFYGHRWWSRVPGVGKLTGDRIIEWLAQQNFPVPPSDYALTPRRKLGKRAVSLARDAVKQLAGRRHAAGQGGAAGLLAGPTGPQTGVPAAQPSPIAEIADSLAEIDREGARLAFSGQMGRNRAPAERCRLDGVQTDMQAIQAWLSLHTGETLKSYRREAERFALWAIYERCKSVSDLDTPDVAAYAQFLTAPFPVEKWVADHRYERGHPGWRPFVKKKSTGLAGLSRLSVAHAVGVLGQMCKWLVGQRYLDSNPFDGLPRMNVANIKPELGTGKALAQKTWEMLREHTERLMEKHAEDATYRRGWLALMLGVGTGMRISELTAAVVGQLQEIDTDSGRQAWGLNVIGKGQKQRLVPLPSKVFDILAEDLHARGYEFQSVLDLDARIPLLARLEAYELDHGAGLEPMSIDAIRDIYQQVFDRAADSIELKDPHVAARLRKASPHQLRHTYASMGVKKMELKHVQDNLGHASIATTSIYLHADKSERFEDTNQFFDKVG